MQNSQGHRVPKDLVSAIDLQRHELVLLDGFEDGLAKSWLMLEPGKQFAAFRKLPSEHKEALFAFCTARMLKAQLFAGLTGSSIARNPVRR